MSHGFSFELLATDPGSDARRGRLVLPHGEVQTPVFMPVGTQATVKTLLPREVEATGAEIILANTYHLMLRPGPDVIAGAGGLHRFMRWELPILTDSGGFQIFSLATRVKVREEGAAFSSHIDGSPHLLTPERAIQLQVGFGSDIAMQLDHVIGLPATREQVRDAMERSLRWLDRGIAEHARLDGAARGTFLFGICQGGTESDLRRESAQRLAEARVSGCAVGGLSVGEPKPVMDAMLDVTVRELPAHKPRYLMGVGSPEDLWNGVARGIDLFDCVLPTRLARNGALFAPEGRVNLKNAVWKNHHHPVDERCDCDACREFTAAYIHHLFRAGEVLALRLASVHNLRFLARQMEQIRCSIEHGTFAATRRAFLERYRLVEAAG